MLLVLIYIELVATKDKTYTYIHCYTENGYLLNKETNKVSNFFKEDFWPWIEIIVKIFFSDHLSLIQNGG